MKNNKDYINTLSIEKNVDYEDFYYGPKKN